MTALRGFTLSQHSYESDKNVAPAQTLPHSSPALRGTR